MTGKPRLTEQAGWIGQGPPLTVEELIDYADRLNRGILARQARWHWFVNSRRLEGGEVQHFLDRRDAGEDVVPWRPSEAEIQATGEVVAELIARRTDQAEFDEMVRRGAVSRRVDERMAGMAKAA